MAKTNGNGHAMDGMTIPLMAPTESATFKIGGQDVMVPALNLYTLGRCKDLLLVMTPDMNWVTYADHVMQIIAITLEDIRPELTLDSLRKACSVPEIRELSASMNELLTVSGFNAAVGEADATAPVPGTGTSMPSPHTSPDEESAAETSTG